MTAMATVAIAVAVILGYIAWEVYVTGSADHARPADAIVVLGALVQPDGSPSPNLEARIRHGVELYHRGLAPYIVCTGGYGDDSMSAAAVARRWAIEHGVPPERVLTADGAMTTREEARRVVELASQRGWHSIILVSHPFHLFRARLLFRRAGLIVYTSPTNTRLGLIPRKERIYLTLRETMLVVGSLIEDSGLVPRSLALWLQKHRPWR